MVKFRILLSTTIEFWKRFSLTENVNEWHDLYMYSKSNSKANVARISGERKHSAIRLAKFRHYAMKLTLQSRYKTWDEWVCF